jgi:hypothetical protein
VPIRIKGDHDPDGEPEECRDQDELAEQENSIETFRALSNYPYVRFVRQRVRTESLSLTRAKLRGDMGFGRRAFWSIVSELVPYQ